MSELREMMPDVIAPGSPVEVRARFDARWKRGFAVAGVTPRGYLVMRQSDGTTLRAEIPFEAVRAVTGR
ncbi:MAG TPA: hypothetical protein VHN98_04215 [Acidimicrobiales bacterium]|nr:hypothetical protein [Acidimicrobiales bacterium]